MTTFLDGPAAAKTLMLKRTPYYLRVCDDGKKLDALDQVGDEPRPSETLYAYRCVKLEGAIHLNISGGRGGFYPRATYEFVPIQPSQEVMARRSSWQEWCEANLPENPPRPITT